MTRLLLSATLVFAWSCDLSTDTNVENPPTADDLDGKFDGTTLHAVLGYVVDQVGNPQNNRCALGVRAAFAAMPSSPTGLIRYRSEGGATLPPRNATLAPFGSWDAHVQSISRIPVPWAGNQWAAVSRANPTVQGGSGFFLVNLAGVGGGDGTRWVKSGEDFTDESLRAGGTALYYPVAGTDHVGGLQASGDLLVAASDGAPEHAGFIEIYQRRATQVAYDRLQRFVLGGHLGEPAPPGRQLTAAALTRLSDGRLLLFALGKDTRKEGWFYMSNETVSSQSLTWTFLSRVTVPYTYQNVTMMTECSTGHIYLLGTGNDDFQGPLDPGTDRADLMLVAWNPTTLEAAVPLISSRAFTSDDGYCTFRAAATAFTDKNGKLTLYCHAHHSNTDLLGEPDSKLKLAEYAPG